MIQHFWIWQVRKMQTIGQHNVCCWGQWTISFSLQHAQKFCSLVVRKVSRKMVEKFETDSRTWVANHQETCEWRILLACKIRKQQPWIFYGQFLFRVKQWLCKRENGLLALKKLQHAIFSILWNSRACIYTHTLYLGLQGASVIQLFNFPFPIITKSHSWHLPQMRPSQSVKSLRGSNDKPSSS